VKHIETFVWHYCATSILALYTFNQSPLLLYCFVVVRCVFLNQIYRVGQQSKLLHCGL